MCDALDRPGLKSDDRSSPALGRARNKGRTGADWNFRISSELRGRWVSGLEPPLGRADVPHAPPARLARYGGAHQYLRANDYLLRVDEVGADALGPGRRHPHERDASARAGGGADPGHAPEKDVSSRPGITWAESEPLKGGAIRTA